MSDKFHDYDALPTDKRAPSMRQEMRVVVVVVLFVVALEIVARMIAPTLDYDREHIHAFPEIIADSATEARQRQLPEVVFLGNSLLMHGLDEATFTGTLGDPGSPGVVATKITPVGTAVLDWIYLYQRYFEDAGHHPDVLVVGFVAHHIHDQEPIKLRRLSRHFLATAALPRLWRTDLRDFHRIAQSTLCHFSALEGDQPEHQLILLDWMISHYKQGLNINNDLVRGAAERRPAGGPQAATPKQTFSRMKRLIDLCAKHGVEVWFVPMPQPDLWSLHPEVVALAEREGMNVLDARRIEGLGDADFSDGYHLGESGRDKFSRWMAQQAERLLRDK